MVSSPSLPYKTLKEYLAWGRANPTSLNYASPGTGTQGHIAGELIAKLAGLKILSVPYKGVGEALPDLLAGNVSCMFDSSVFPHVKAGNLTLLGVLMDERYAEFPDVGTMKEQGLPEYEVPIWFGAYAPAGVPAPILNRLHAEIATMHGDPEFQAKQFAGGIRVYREVMSLAELRTWVAKLSAQFASLMQRADIKLDS